MVRFGLRQYLEARLQRRGHCWVWCGGITADGYGEISNRFRPMRYAHQAVLSLAGLRTAHGQHIDHLCRNRACANPLHLQIVTIAENVLRGSGVTAMNKVKTHCKWGHSLADFIPHKRPGGRVERECRKCMANRRKRYQK